MEWRRRRWLMKRGAIATILLRMAPLHEVPASTGEHFAPTLISAEIVTLSPGVASRPRRSPSLLRTLHGCAKSRQPLRPYLVADIGRSLEIGGQDAP